MLLMRAGETVAVGSKFNLPQIPHIWNVYRTFLTPNGFTSPEPTELLAAQEADCLNIVYLRDVLQVSAKKTVEQTYGADEIWPFRQAHKTFDQHEQRVIAADV